MNKFAEISRRELISAISLVSLSAFNHVLGAPLSARRDTDDLYTPEVDAAIQRGVGALSNELSQVGIMQAPRPGKNAGIFGLVGLSLLSVGGQADRPPLGEELQKLASYTVSRASETGFIHESASQNYGPMY